MQNLKEEIHLYEQDLAPLFGEYCLLKCKGFSQNSVFDKYRANIFLSARYDFRNLREISVFLKKAHKLGIVSVTMLQTCLRSLQSLIAEYGYFNPNMEEEAYLHYFFSFTKTRKANTIKSYITSLNIFLKFLATKGYIVRNIAQIKMNFLQEKTLPSVLNEEDYSLFLHEAQNLSEDTLHNLRNKLAILLVYYTGIRTRELANISLADIKEENQQYRIKIKGKRAKERIVAVKKHFIHALLQKYLHARQIHNKLSTYLFQLKNAQCPPKLNISLKSILAKIGCLQHRGNKLHLLRHSFASFVYRKSKDILLTQKILGHSSVNSTLIYIHINNDAHERVANFFSNCI